MSKEKSTKTQKFIFTGTAYWARLASPDEAFGTKSYKITVDLDKPSIKAFKESGLQLEPKEGDGGFRVTFRRDTKKLNPDGEVTEYGPPSVFHADGVTKLEDDVLVGNESKVAVKVEVFDTAKGKGHRLHAVRVDELKKYVPAEAPDVF
jgi:hypothetical protein